MAIGDFLSQKAEKYFVLVEHNPRQATNWSRLFNVVIFASLFGVPVLHFYYMLLEFLFPGQSPIHIFLKVCCDVLLFTPLSILVFFAGIGFMEGLTLSEIQQQINSSYLSTLRTSIAVWPLASLVNFYFIATEYRLFFTGCVSIVWNAYLSSVKHTSVLKGPILPVTIKTIPPTLSSLNKPLLFPAKVSVI